MKLSGLLFILLAALLLSFSAQAQEETPMIEGPDPSHREVNFSEDKTLIFDHPSQNSIIRDSVAVTPKIINKTTRPELPKEPQKARNEEDALGFNFLFYMIQKYKLSDMIENQ